MSAANRETRSSNSSSNNEWRSEGFAPITGGRRLERYVRNMSGSKLDTAGGGGPSVASGESWWFPFVRLVCDSISVDTRVDKGSSADFIKLRVDFDLFQR